MNIETMDKVAVLKVVINPVMDQLAAMVPEGQEVSADDLVDFFSLGIAAILDNDSPLRTPRDLRLGSETAAKLIERRAKEFRAMQDQAGASWLSVAMASRDFAPAAGPTIN